MDEVSRPLLADDHERRLFEAAWMHRYKGMYYFSYSTGFTHFLVYATGISPCGPFTYQGRILEPVIGWTTHHSICEFEERWWLFYHESSLSGKKDHLRNVKIREIFYDEQGRIQLSPPRARRVKYSLSQQILVSRASWHESCHQFLNFRA